ncbi:hypothetical protein ElyMa_000703800 [Elysia marginata]|uniref:Uncharacterized protein n=1 Tax=Elysia marginata TaxID=1093978 RepID=A0AAV4GK88_9GAST|nr:hypothetical protein ElyMa_000703800 [Elysia marginata]
MDKSRRTPGKLRVEDEFIEKEGKKKCPGEKETKTERMRKEWRLEGGRRDIDKIRRGDRITKEEERTRVIVCSVLNHNNYNTLRLVDEILDGS